MKTQQTKDCNGYKTGEQGCKTVIKADESLLKKHNKTDVQFFYTLKLVFSFNTFAVI